MEFYDPNLVQVLSLERPTIGCTKVLQEELLTKNNLNDVHLHRLPREFYWYSRSEENVICTPKNQNVPDLPERQEWFFSVFTIYHSFICFNEFTFLFLKSKDFGQE